jgi:large subunit ribosomal protein L23
VSWKSWASGDLMEKKTKKEEVQKKSRLSTMKRLVKPRKREKIIEEKEPEKAEKGKKASASIKDPFAVLKFVLMTEKAIQLIERENKLVFIIDRKCSKSDVKQSAESAFHAAVDDVKTMIDRKGRKKAFIKFKEPGVAGDIAMRLGII